MEKYRYSVIMQTPLGNKYGSLAANISESSVSGWLEMLKHKEPFNGTIDNFGNCKISGKIITLMRTIPFTAIGKLTASAVYLTIKGERNIFELSGTPCSEGGQSEK